MAGRRTTPSSDATGTARAWSSAGFRELQSKDAINLGRDAIHAVHNPRQMYTGAIHIYGGDFFAKPRSEWADESSPEMPYNVEGAMRAFADANERWLAQQQ